MVCLELSAGYPQSMAGHDDLVPPRSRRLRLALETTQKLLAVSVVLRRHWVSTAATVGLSEPQARLMLEVDEEGAMSMGELARCLDYDASNLTNLADRLERQGLLERSSNPSDRRIKSVALTAEGRRVRAEFWRRLTGSGGPLTSLGLSDLQVLEEVLDTILTTDTGHDR